MDRVNRLRASSRNMASVHVPPARPTTLTRSMTNGNLHPKTASSNATVARSTVPPKRGQAQTTSKPVISNLKPSTSQSNVKKACTTPTSRVAKSQRDSPAPTPTVDKKEQPTAAAPQSPAPDDDLEPVPRIRSGSYTISRPVSSPQDLNRNVIKDETEDDEREVQSSPRVNGGVPALHSEAELRASIGRHVLANGKVGILRYFGPVNFMEGFFCGIELDQPTGLHDGQFNGVRYFKTNFKHGTFVSMDHVQILDLDGPSGSSTSVTSGQNAGVWPEGELLTDVEPNLLEGTLNDSMMSSSAVTFDLSSSLSFLKGSRFPGMDTSLTPSELMAQLQGQEAQGMETEREALFSDGDDHYSGNEAFPRIVEQSHNKSIGFNPSRYSTPASELFTARSQLQSSSGQGTALLGSGHGAILLTGQASQMDATMCSGDWSDPALTPQRFDTAEDPGSFSRQSAFLLTSHTKGSPGATTAKAATTSYAEAMPNGYANAFSHVAKGFDAMGVLVRHYAETVVPNLLIELARANDQIAASNNARMNMENENRLLKEYYEIKIQDQRRESEQKIQKMQADLERRIAENSDLIRKSIIEEHKVLVASKAKEVQQYKAEAARLEKMVRDSNADVESMRAVAELRSKEHHDLLQRCHELEKEIEESARLRQNVAALQQENTFLTNALEKKMQVEELLQEKISQLKDSLRREEDWNRRLQMGKEELEFKLSQSMYEQPSSRLVEHSPTFSTPAPTRPTMSRIRRSKSMATRFFGTTTEEK